MVLKRGLLRVLHCSARTVSEGGLKWPLKLPFLSLDQMHEIEKHWKDEVVSETETASRADTKYILSMFPYPSGNLHMGHVRVYSTSDCIARFYGLNQFKVIHPIGWDAFGLPAENAAIEKKQDPHIWTASNIAEMKLQLKELGCKFDWQRELNTADPTYYKWTQLIFLELFNAGLAYQRESFVNWDPVDLTVLADEQIDSEGRSWRSGAKAVKKPLRQWFVRTTAFSKELYENLDDVTDWADVVSLQRNWIGKCNVYRVTVDLKFPGKSNFNEQIDLCLDSLSELSTGACVVVKSTHILNQAKYWEDGQADAGGNSRLRVKCENPVTGQLMDIVVMDNYPFGENADAHLVSNLNDYRARDVVESEEQPTERRNDDEDKEENRELLQLLKEKGCHVYLASRKLRDWVVSRQRYWGTPIPVIHCPKCKAVPVPSHELPVVLPGTNSSCQTEHGTTYNLAAFTDWRNVRCPACCSHAHRETDTLDTFFDSSWYFLRYLDVHNRLKPFDPSLVNENLPVDIYVGGKEHATLHLYYARFMFHFLRSIGWVQHTEPFARFLAQGMVMNKAYQIAETAQYIPEERVTKEGDLMKDKKTGKIVTCKWEKMSKSKHNGVNPLSLLEHYGRDFTRLLVMANVSPQSYHYKGLHHWINRITWLVNAYLTEHLPDSGHLAAVTKAGAVDGELPLRKKYNHTVRQVSFHMENTHLLNAAISSLQSLTNDLRKCPEEIIRTSPQFAKCLRSLIIMLFPFAPHLSAELWSALARIPASKEFLPEKMVWEQHWPALDEDAAMMLIVKIRGERTSVFEHRITFSEFCQLDSDRALQVALRIPAVQKMISSSRMTSVAFKKEPFGSAYLTVAVN